MEKKVIKPEELKDSLISGAANVIKNRDKLNKINVFPVPDGDTGSNLAQTFKSIIQTLEHRDFDSVHALLNEVSRNMLKNARGNSGVIFSQFFYSFSKSLKGKKNISIKDFAKSMKQSIKRTYEALEKPIEGTVLTVIREVSEEGEKIAEKVTDFKEFLDHLQETAKKSLEKTKETLPQLRKAKVVDAGGLGFLYFLQGLSMYFHNKRINLDFSPEELELTAPKQDFEFESNYRFCTEALLEGNGLNTKGIKSILKSYGDSIIVVGDENLLHVHIHTDEPEKVFELLSNYGSIKMKKVDDMHAQVREEDKQPYAILVDSGMDLTPDYYQKYGFKVIPFQVFVGDKSFKEGVDIAREEVMKLLTSKRWKELKTSQPAFSDYIEAYKELTKRARYVYAIHLSSNLSGTYSTSVTAAQRISRNRIVVFDTKLFSIAAGLLALRIREMIDRGFPPETIREEAEKIRKKSFAVITLETMRNLVHGGRAGKLKGEFVDLLCLKLIITIDENGYLKKLTQAFGSRGALNKVLRLLEHKLDKDRVYDFGIAHVNTPERVEIIKDFITSRFKYRDIILNYTTPAIAVYGGPGAYGVFAVPVEV